jgi:hypothetical protein
MLARTYAVNQWVVPALTALCEIADPLTLTEARPMRIEDIVLVAAVREEVRGRGRIDASKVTRIVEVALAGKLPRFEGDSASRPGLEGGVAKQGIRSTAAESHVDSEREDGNGPNYFTQWPSKNVAKLPDENATQGVGKATVLEQAVPKFEGERDAKPFGGRFEVAAQAAVDSAFSSLPGKITVPKQRPLAGKQASKGPSLFASVEKPSTSTHETPTKNIPPFAFGQSGVGTPNPLMGTPFRPVESGSPSVEPPTNKARTPEVDPADSKAPVTRK